MTIADRADARATEIAAAVRRGEVSPRAVALAALARADAAQPRTNAFTHIAREAALARAERVAGRLEAGEDLPLAGVPLVVKDNICVEGIPATAASSSLAGFVPPYSATVVARLEAAGCVPIAMANCDEFGMGGSSENSAYGAVRNPWDGERVAGGSSGGSAAAVAAGVAPLALGTDTGGSVRQPAAFTGVIGFKPTYGTFSRYGVMAFASSLDQVGILTRSVADLALAAELAAGSDPMDATTLDAPPLAPGRRPGGAVATGGGEDDGTDGEASGETPLAGLRVGVVAELSGDGIEAGVRRGLERVRGELAELGAEVVEASLPRASYGVPTYYLVAMAEASSNLARYDGMIYSARSGDEAEGQADVMMRSRGAAFGPEVRRRVLMGTYALSAGFYDEYYGRALRARRRLAEDFDRAFAEVDLLIAPTAPTAPFRLGAKVDDPLAMYLGDIATCLANLAGIGGVSVPAGLDDAGLPVGVQLMAPARADASLLRAASALERRRGADAFAPLAPAFR